MNTRIYSYSTTSYNVHRIGYSMTAGNGECTGRADVKLDQ